MTGSPWSREGQHLCGNRTIIKHLTQVTQAQNIYLSDDSCVRSQAAGKRRQLGGNWKSVWVKEEIDRKPGHEHQPPRGTPAKADLRTLTTAKTEPPRDPNSRG